MTYSPWGSLAGMPHLTLVWERLVGRLGEYRHETGEIVLDPRLRYRQRRCTLGHELVHAERGDVPSVSPVLAARQELQADREAARRLITIDALGDALVWANSPAEAAAVLDVDQATLDVRLQHLHPSERHYLRRMMAAKEGTQ